MHNKINNTCSAHVITGLFIACSADSLSQIHIHVYLTNFQGILLVIHVFC